MKADAAYIMRKDDGGAIVAVVVVEGEAVDGAPERAHHLRTCRPPDVDTQVKPPGFGFAVVCLWRFAAAGRSVCDRTVEMFTAGIEGPVFAIAADHVAGLVFLQRP